MYCRPWRQRRLVCLYFIPNCHFQKSVLRKGNTKSRLVFCSIYSTYLPCNHHSLSGCLIPTVHRASLNSFSKIKLSLRRGFVRCLSDEEASQRTVVDFTQAVSCDLLLTCLPSFVKMSTCANFWKRTHQQTACWSYKTFLLHKEANYVPNKPIIQKLGGKVKGHPVTCYRRRKERSVIA